MNTPPINKITDKDSLDKLLRQLDKKLREDRIAVKTRIKQPLKIPTKLFIE